MARLAVVASHPIQYQAPFFRALAREVDLEVFFCHRQDAAGQAAAGFGVEFEWDVPLLDGYRHTWLVNRSPDANVSSFSGCDTPEIADRIRDGRFDACLVSGWYLKSYLQAIRACRRLSIPVLSRGDSQLATGRSPVWRAAKYLPYRMLMRAINAHLYVGQANREYLRHYGVTDDRLFFAPHFVDNSFFATGACVARRQGKPQAIRDALGLPGESTVFAFAGKLLERKRPEDFLRALGLARARGADVAGLMIGSGPLDQRLRALAATMPVPIGFTGFRNQSELPAYLSAADAIVLPSDGGETWGLVVNEAMACGLPAIVSTAVGCGPDLIAESETGYRFPVGDVPALSNAIELLRSDLTTDTARIAAAVHEKIDQYSCAAAVRGTLSALERVHQ